MRFALSNVFKNKIKGNARAKKKNFYVHLKPMYRHKIKLKRIKSLYFSKKSETVTSNVHIY